MSIDRDGPTDLYRHWKDDALLYVGISFSTVARLAQHKSQSHWSREITHVTVVKYPTRAEAVEAERIAIQTEGPLHNRARRRQRAPFCGPPHPDAEAIRKWYEERAVVPYFLPPCTPTDLLCQFPDFKGRVLDLAKTLSTIEYTPGQVVGAESAMMYAADHVVAELFQPASVPYLASTDLLNGYVMGGGPRPWWGGLTLREYYEGGSYAALQKRLGRISQHTIDQFLQEAEEEAEEFTPLSIAITGLNIEWQDELFALLGCSWGYNRVAA